MSLVSVSTEGVAVYAEAFARLLDCIASRRGHFRFDCCYHDENILFAFGDSVEWNLIDIYASGYQAVRDQGLNGLIDVLVYSFHDGSVIGHHRRLVGFLNALEFLLYYSVDVRLKEISHISLCNDKVVVDVFLRYFVHVVDEIFVRNHEVG